MSSFAKTLRPVASDAIQDSTANTQKMRTEMGDAGTEHAGGASKKNGLRHEMIPFVVGYPYLAMPPDAISLQKLDSAFLFWNTSAMLDLTDLRAFVRIANLNSISGAARALRMPNSSVSRSLV